MRGAILEEGNEIESRIFAIVKHSVMQTAGAMACFSLLEFEKL